MSISMSAAVENKPINRKQGSDGLSTLTDERTEQTSHVSQTRAAIHARQSPLRRVRFEKRHIVGCQRFLGELPEAVVDVGGPSHILLVELPRPHVNALPQPSQLRADQTAELAVELLPTSSDAPR